MLQIKMKRRNRHRSVSETRLTIMAFGNDFDSVFANTKNVNDKKITIKTTRFKFSWTQCIINQLSLIIVFNYTETQLNLQK